MNDHTESTVTRSGEFSAGPALNPLNMPAAINRRTERSEILRSSEHSSIVSRASNSSIRQARWISIALLHETEPTSAVGRILNRESFTLRLRPASAGLDGSWPSTVLPQRHTGSHA